MTWELQTGGSSILRWNINASVNRYPLSEDIEVIGLQEFLELIESKN